MPRASEVLDDRRAELGALELRRALHHPVEIVCNRLGGNRAVKALRRNVLGRSGIWVGAPRAELPPSRRCAPHLDDQVSGLVPAQVAEHHLAGQDDGAGVLRGRTAQFERRVGQCEQSCARRFPSRIHWHPIARTTMSRFAYLGAVPCVASKMAWPVL